MKLRSIRGVNGKLRDGMDWIIHTNCKRGKWRMKMKRELERFEETNSIQKWINDNENPSENVK